MMNMWCDGGGASGDNLQFLHGECQIRAEISATIRTNGSLQSQRGSILVRVQAVIRPGKPDQTNWMLKNDIQ